MRFKVASAFLRAGATLGTQASERAVRDLIGRLHPRSAARPLSRVGGAHDGGYLLPDDLDGIAACFSPGVATTASFEEEMIRRGIPCFLADGSVAAPPITHELIQFSNVFIGTVEKEGFVTLDAWVDRHAPGRGDLLLQMDIEGAEWPVLLNASDATLRRFRMIVVELHDIDRIIDKVGFTLIGSALERLLRDFVVVHSHPNNTGGVVAKNDVVLPRVLEVTLWRKDRADVTGYATQFPHPLDMPNDPDLPDVVLPPIWHR